MSKHVGVYGNGSDLFGIDQSVSGSDSFNSDIYAGVLVHLVRVHDTGIYGSYVLYVFRHMGEIHVNTEMILEYL